MRTLIPFLLFLMFANASAEIVQVNDSTSTTIPLTPPPEHHKGTVAPVIVWQDDRNLTFPSWCADCMACLADEDDDIVFTGNVGIDGTITLPTTLQGTYTLYLYATDITYYGYIDL